MDQVVIRGQLLGLAQESTWVDQVDQFLHIGLACSAHFERHRLSHCLGRHSVGGGYGLQKLIHLIQLNDLAGLRPKCLIREVIHLIQPEPQCDSRHHHKPTGSGTQSDSRGARTRVSV